MGLLLQYWGRCVRDCLLYCLRSGSWWVPVVMVVLGLAVALAVTAQAVVPHAVYVLF